MACDQLAAFFALPPSQLLVRQPPSRVQTGPRPSNALAEEGAGTFGASTNGNRPGSRMRGAFGRMPGVGGGRGVGRSRGAFGAIRPRGRARDNASVQFATAVASSAGSASGEDPTAASEGAAAVVEKEQNATAGELGAAGARQARGTGGKWRNGVKSAKKNLPVAAKEKREMLWDGKNAGSLPNMMWRAVEMEDLRLHPHFVGLPEPEEVKIESATDYRKFRQGSKQWCMLHDGRLTTSRMAPILGIYESVAMSKLGVPRSLCGHHKAMDAYYHLIRPPCSVADLEAEACNGVPPAQPAAGGPGGAGGAGSLLAGEPMTRGQRRRARGKAKKQQQQQAAQPPPAVIPATSHGGASNASALRVWEPAEPGARFSHQYKPARTADGPAFRVESAGHAVIGMVVVVII